ncbi:MAG: HAMP domain-containing protein [Pseudomonadales bacterium]|nr:HAMP domain-containing protein [Pseudomonadales bacterium]
MLNKCFRSVAGFFNLEPLDACRVLRKQLPQYIPIASKLAIVITSLVTFGILVVGITVGTNQIRLLETELNKFALTLLQQMADSAKEPLLAGDQLNLEMVTHGVITHEGILGSAIYDDEGQMLTQDGRQVSITPEEFMLSLKKNGNASYAILPQKKAVFAKKATTAYLYPLYSGDLKAGYVLLVFDKSSLTKARRDTVFTITLVTVLMAFGGMLVSVYLSYWLTKPINQILDASKAISEGRYDVNLSERRNDELGILMSSMNKMGQGLLQKQQVEEVFSRYVSPQVARKAIGDLTSLEEVKLGGRHIDASVLFADIVGFTSLSESMPADEISELLNYYFSLIEKSTEFCHGYIDKYIGDCAMIVFGVPYEVDDHRFNSLSCAWMILQVVEQINVVRKSKGLPIVELRIGANSGSMLAGNIGSKNRMEYTVVGDAVNLASRLSHAGGSGEIILTGTVFEHSSVRDKIAATAQGEIQLRGKSKPSRVFSLDDICDPFKQDMLEKIKELVADNK